MRNILIIAVILVSGMQVLGQQKNFIDQPYIEVSGKAELEIVPNEISVNITLNEADTKGKVSVEKLEKEMLKTLKSLKIDTNKDLKLKDYSSSFRFYKLKKDDIHKSKEYELLLHDSKQIGILFYTLEQKGIANVQIAGLDHSDIESYKLQVITNAIKAAKDKASVLATAIDQEIGKAIHIMEQVNYNNYRESNTLMMISRNKEMEMDDLPTIEFENIKLTAQVNCKFILK